MLGGHFRKSFESIKWNLYLHMFTIGIKGHFTFQANRKDLQRFLGLNDCEEMVYIRNVRKPQRNESHQTRNGSHHGGNGPPQRLHHSGSHETLR